MEAEADLGRRIVAEARTWLGTPYRHAAREKGLGVDCVGLLIGVARDLGLTDYDNRNYDAIVDADRFRAELLRFLAIVPGGIAEARAGDVLLIRVRGVAQHVAIWTGEGTVVHAINDARQVVEHRWLIEGWGEKVAAVLRWKEIAPHG